MNDTDACDPLTRARIEQIFPKLTPTQIRRIRPYGRARTTKREVLSEQGDSAASFFVVNPGELEILRLLWTY
jgi:hypothetical protein